MTEMEAKDACPVCRGNCNCITCRQAEASEDGHKVSKHFCIFYIIIRVPILEVCTFSRASFFIIQIVNSP